MGVWVSVGNQEAASLFGRWFCPWEAIATKEGRPGPAPPRRPSYLFTTLSDGGRELTDYHIHTLDTGLFELLHLLFHCGFKSEVRSEEARPAPGEEGSGRGGVRAKQPGSRVGQDGTGMGEERDTDTEKERTEDNVSAGPSPPPHPGSGLPGAAKIPQGSVGMARGLRDQAPAHTRPLLSSDPHPAAPRPPPSSAALSCLLFLFQFHFCLQPGVLQRSQHRLGPHPPILLSARIPSATCNGFILTSPPLPGLLHLAAQAVHCTNLRASTCIDCDADEAAQRAVQQPNLCCPVPCPTPATLLKGHPLPLLQRGLGKSVPKDREREKKKNRKWRW